MFSGACVGVVFLLHPAFVVLLGPIAAAFFVTALVQVWSQGTLEIEPARGRLRLRERTLFRERVREWNFKEIEGLTVFGDDRQIGALHLKFPYGNRVSLGGGDRTKLGQVAVRLQALTGIRLE